MNEPHKYDVDEEITVTVEKALHPNDNYSSLVVNATIGPRGKNYHHEFRYNEELILEDIERTLESFATELHDWMGSIIAAHREVLEPYILASLGSKIAKITGTPDPFEE